MILQVNAYDCVVRMPSVRFASVVKNLAGFGTAVRMTCSLPEGIMLSAIDGEVAVVRTRFPPGVFAENDLRIGANLNQEFRAK